MSGSPTNAESWKVVDYEAGMFFRLLDLLGEEPPESIDPLTRNARTESTCLHARILTEILLSKGTRDDDVRLDRLLPGFTSPAVDALSRHYGTQGKEGTPCWTLNKMLAHPTTHRGPEYDYNQLLTDLRPLLAAVWNQVSALRCPPPPAFPLASDSYSAVTTHAKTTSNDGQF